MSSDLPAALPTRPTPRCDRTAVTDLAAYRELRLVDAALDACTNVLGDPMPPFARRLVIDLIRQPNEELWDAAHGISLSRNLTLWQALLEHTEYDVRTGPHQVVSAAAGGSPTISRTAWTAVPTADQVRRALLTHAWIETVGPTASGDGRGGY